MTVVVLSMIGVSEPETSESVKVFVLLVFGWRGNVVNNRLCSFVVTSEAKPVMLYWPLFKSLKLAALLVRAPSTVR